MKLSPTLSKFLAANKQLSLPGIGTFYSEEGYDPDYDGKKSPIPNKVSFKQERVSKADDSLIEFISKETGKMKVLSEADLSSQLEDVLQYLNTGKPYFFSGIGTLAKKHDGRLEFFQEKFTVSSEKKQEPPITEKNYIPQSYIDNTRTGRKNLTPAIIIITLSLIAIAATVWFYMNNQEKQAQNLDDVTEKVDTPAPPVAKTDTGSVSKDSLAVQSGSNSEMYTYVLEIAKEPRASKRFNQLKTIKWPVELEVVDSLHKRIVMKLPAAGADTLRIKDSLRILSGRNVWIAR